MNTEGCPSGYFRDEIGVPFKSSECNGNVFAWLGIMIPLTFVRGCLAVIHFVFWFQREARTRKHARGGESVTVAGAGPGRQYHGSQRLPIVPTLSMSTFVSQAIMVGLVSFNIINATNGTSYPMLTIFYGFSQVAHQMFALKLVRLGRRLAFMSPAARKQHKANQKKKNGHRVADVRGDQGEDKASIAMSLLTKFDTIQRMLFVVWAIALFLHKLSELFLIPFVQPAPNLALIRLGMISATVLNFCTTAQILHQFSRVINAVNSSAFKAGSSAEPGTMKNTTTSGPNKIHDVVRSMRRQQIHQALLSIPLFSIYFSIVVTLSIPYWMIMLFCFLETTGTMSMTLGSIAKLISTSCPCRRFRKQQGKQATSTSPTDMVAASQGGSVMNPVQATENDRTFTATEPASSFRSSMPKPKSPLRKSRTALIKMNELEKVLKDNGKVSRAIALCSESHCSEPLMFLQALANGSSPVELLKEYIAVGSENEIVLPEKLRDALVKKISKHDEDGVSDLLAQARQAMLNEVRFNSVTVNALLYY